MIKYNLKYCAIIFFIKDVFYKNNTYLNYDNLHYF